jgi:surface antigen Omp85-like protein
VLIYDTRDNIFTPTKGLYVEAGAGLYSQALGGDADFQYPTLTALAYVPLAKTLTLGVKADAMLSFGDMPFYLRPGISLRGVEARRYLGEHAAGVEAELRWQFTAGFSLVASRVSPPPERISIGSRIGRPPSRAAGDCGISWPAGTACTWVSTSDSVPTARSFRFSSAARGSGRDAPRRRGGRQWTDRKEDGMSSAVKSSMNRRGGLW